MPFRFALRALSRHPATAAINVVGLAVALAAALLIALHVQDHLVFDRFHAKADRIVQVLIQNDGGPEQTVTAQTPVPMAKALEEAFPEVRRAVQMTTLDGVVRHEGGTASETLTFVSAGFFDTFSFGLDGAEAQAALARPDGVVLAAPLADRLFGRGGAVGERLSVRLDDQERTFTVTAVAPPAPPESSLSYSVVLPFESLAQYRRSFANPSWGTFNPRVYLELEDASAVPSLAAKLPAFLSSQAPADLAENWSLRLLPLADVHLTPGVEGQLAPPRDPLYLGVLGGIGLLVLLMACVNFTTLAVARAAGRAREVGVRKAVGAVRAQLVRRFWGETAVLVAVALGLGMALVAAALPTFNALVGRDLTLWGGVGWRTAATVLGLLAVVTAVAGAYPALYLSGFEPVRVLRGRGGGRGRPALTRALVTLQFAVSTALVVVLLVMARQMHHVAQADLGFESARVVRLATNVWDAGEGAALVGRLRTALADEPGVVAVAGLSEEIGDAEAFANVFPVATGGVEVETRVLGADAGLPDALGLTVADGRALRPDEGGAAVLVNRAFADAAGWASPVGRTVSVPMTVSDATVVGVLDDFHYRSLRAEVEPLVVHASPPWVRAVYVRLASGPLDKRLAAVGAGWDRAAPGLPFEPAFLDDAVAAQYAADRRWTRVVAWASAFAVGIGLLGLLGLAALAAQERTKEVGIRKALGATVAGLVVLLSRDLVRLVALAFVVAAPVAYLVADRWLETFASRAPLGPAPFVAGGLATLLLAVAVVGVHALRAATADPVRALRSE